MSGLRHRSAVTLVPVQLRSGLALGAVFAVGVVAFGWPFLTPVSYTHLTLPTKA